MARTFRRKHSAHPIAELNVTNMIDLGFTLLIIFMITTSYSQQEQSTPINLPTVAKSPQLQKPDKNEKFVAVGVDASGNFFVGDSATPVSIVELRAKLKTLAAEPKQPVMRVRGDGKAFYEKVAQVFNELEKAGLTRVWIDYQVKD